MRGEDPTPEQLEAMRQHRAKTMWEPEPNKIRSVNSFFNFNKENPIWTTVQQTA